MITILFDIHTTLLLVRGNIVCRSKNRSREVENVSQMQCVRVTASSSTLGLETKEVREKEGKWPRSVQWLKTDGHYYHACGRMNEVFTEEKEY